jgi:tRNA (guanine-N(7)-)-methyltransferase subunit TRM82
MPKRPCAIEVVMDDTTILCGDKFGDVYSLPLFDDGHYSADQAGTRPALQPQSDFKPSATNFTVHTKRNRIALESQMKQAQQGLTPRKEALQFEHKLLLGHVSMLTDLKFAFTTIDGKPRPHIITADRDEHIRISRGPPQAHVIEGYCLGHTAFISKICLVPGTELLLSGGGDDWIGVWNWRTNELVQKLDLREALRLCVDPDTLYAKDDYLLSVSGIWTVSWGEPTNDTWAVIVALEQFPTLFVAVIHPTTFKISRFYFQRCAGCPLDVVAIDNGIVISLDPRIPGGRNRLESLQLGPWVIDNSLIDQWEKVQPRLSSIAHTCDERVAGLNQLPDAGPAPSKKDLDGLLYGVSDLRKRGGMTFDANHAADEAADE